MPALLIEDRRRQAREWYARNREAQHVRIAQRKKSAREILKVFICEKLSTGCVDCGEKDIVVLDFDHGDEVTKLFTICDAYNRCFGIKKVTDEIAKCEIRCANCHRRRTAKQGGYWKSLIGPV